MGHQRRPALVGRYITRKRGHFLADSFIGRCCDLFLLRAATAAPGPINKSPDNTPALKELPCGYARAILDA
jgi:hypothetical protein